MSLYNETDAGPIYPTPVVGMVGELPDPDRAAGTALRPGDAVALVGPFAPSLAGSELAKLRGDLDTGLPATSIERVRGAIELVRELVREGEVGRGSRRERRRPRLRARRVRAGWRGSGVRAALDGLVELRGASGETCLFGEGPGGFVIGLSPKRSRGSAHARGSYPWMCS